MTNSTLFSYRLYCGNKMEQSQWYFLPPSILTIAWKKSENFFRNKISSEIGSFSAQHTWAYFCSCYITIFVNFLHLFLRIFRALPYVNKIIQAFCLRQLLHNLFIYQPIPVKICVDILYSCMWYANANRIPYKRHMYAVAKNMEFE